MPAADGEEAVRFAEKHRPNVAILDISMPILDGIEATRQIKQPHPDVKVVILIVLEDEEYAYQVLRAGASAYLLKTAGKKEIFDAIRSAFSGERFFSPGISRFITEGFMIRVDDNRRHTEVQQRSLNAGLTEREPGPSVHRPRVYQPPDRGHPLPEFPHPQYGSGEPHAEARCSLYRGIG